jgi:hypothetical protein
VGTDQRTASEAPLVLAGLSCILLVSIATLCVIGHDVASYAGSALAHGVVYLAAVWWVINRGAPPRAVVIILVLALVMRGIAMTAPHNVLTSDALRYVWDGRIQWAGFNPYLYAPADERLAHLRDLVYFPFINQKETAVTIYPPFAEMIFMAAVAIRDGIEGLQLVMLAFEGLITWALLGCLRHRGLPPGWVLIYAWHPLPIWEFASQAHIDAATTALVMLAILARLEGRYWLTGVAIGLAAATKYYPLLLLAVLLPRPLWLDRVLAAVPIARRLLPIEPASVDHASPAAAHEDARHVWTAMLGACIATLVLVYLPYSWTAGTRVVGFLSRHLDNEGYWAGYGFHIIWVLRDLAIADPPGRLYIAAAAVALGSVLGWCFLVQRPSEIKATHLVLIACAFVWLTSPHYAWYFAWIVPLAALVPSRAALLFTVVPFVLYLPYISPRLGGSMAYGIVFGLPLLVFLVERVIAAAAPRTERC